MRTKKITNWKNLGYIFSLLSLIAIVACDDDETPEPDPFVEVTAVFDGSATGTVVTFTNASVGADTYSWDFGDGSEPSTDENPVHEYATAGVYQVTLTASNDTDSDEVTNEVSTQNGGALASKIVGKTWIPAHGEVWSYLQGVAVDGVFAEDGAGNFGWGDANTGGWAFLDHRPSLANDEYVFNVDGTMSVDFKGDFWAEYLLWTDQGDLDITGGTLPDNEAGESMSAFANPDDNWTFEVDEANSVITCSGLGAHILNPRLVYSNTHPASVKTPQPSVWYDIVRVTEDAGVADTLVLYAWATEGSEDLGHYVYLHSYENEADIPPRKDIPEPGQYTGSVASTSVSHSFAAEDGAGAGVLSVAGPYAVEYGVTIGGETCASFTRAADGSTQWANYLIRAGSDGAAAEIDFSTGTTVAFDVYMPSSNDFSAELQNLVRVRFIDESQFPNNFWEHYIQLDEADIALDQWVSLSFDFSTLISDGQAAGNMSDGVMIEFGEVGTVPTSESVLYVKDFRIE